MLQEQADVEPGASYGDQFLVRLPTETLVAVRLDFVIQDEDGSYWNATSVVKL